MKDEDIIKYCRSCIQYREEKIMSLDEKKVSLNDEEQTQINDLIMCIQNQILIYLDIIDKVRTSNKSMYESQCKRCKYFAIKKGIAHCLDCSMDEDLFIIGMVCHMYQERK